MDDSAQLAGLIERQDLPRLASFLDMLPPTNVSSMGRGLALGDDFVLRLMGLTLIAGELARGASPAAGGLVADAVLRVARAHLDGAGSAAQLAEAAAQAGAALATAHARAGDHEALVALSDDLERRLQGRTDGVCLAGLRLKAADSMMALGRVEDAEAAIAALEKAGCDDPSLPFARQRLNARLQSATDLADARSPDRRVLDQHRDSEAAIAEALRALAAGNPQLAALAKTLVLDEQGEAPADLWDVFDRGKAGAARLSSLLGVGDNGPEGWRNRVNASCEAFRDNGGRDPALLGPALDSFRAAIAWYDSNNHREDGHNARWCAYIAERRLGRPGPALDLLEELASRLEFDRRGISDPLRRGNDPFPMLPAARVECAELVEDPRRMLAAIEAAKGRALADLRTLADGRAFDETALHMDAAAVEELVAGLGIGYVSFIAIDVAIYAVAVWPDGGWHSIRIDMDEKARRKLSGRIDPMTWVNHARRETFDLGAALAPVTEWLVPLLPKLPGDGHIVFSPDGELHLWPLQMAATPDGPLGARVGVSRVHGIDMVRRIAAAPPLRPSRSIAVHLPVQGEEADEGRAAAMKRTLSVLPDAAVVPPEQADTERIARLEAAGALLYVNAHGVFPEERMTGIDPNPYRSAGMLLAQGGMLPERSAFWPHRLTPAVVLESPDLDVERATVALQGCVSGLAKEGRGGDALGLEWAFLARGADSVLASHWNVDYRPAGAFCRHFCKAWLVDGESRIAAWRRAAAETNRDPEGGEAYEWGAFSLTGDWR